MSAHSGDAQENHGGFVSSSQPVGVCRQGLWGLEVSTCVSIVSTCVTRMTMLWRPENDAADDAAAAAAAHRPTARSEWLLAMTAKGG